MLSLDFWGLGALATSGRADEDQPLVGLGLAVQPTLNLAHERIGAHLGERIGHFASSDRGRAGRAKGCALTRMLDHPGHVSVGRRIFGCQ